MTQAISGLGGVGKTALAVEYAHIYRDHYNTLLFALADSITSLNSAYKAIAMQLGLPQATSDDFAVVAQAVKHHLNTATPSRKSITPYLLILDNADFGITLKPNDLKSFLPNTPTGHVLLTTRAQTLHGGLNIKPNHVLHLNVMVEEEAFRFLAEGVSGANATLTGDEIAAVSELARELGYLPLALEQAAAYIAQPGRTFRNYLNLYRKRSIEFVERSAPETGDYNKTIATTWQISFDEVERECPAAADLLRLCAFVAPDAIPIEMILAAANGEVESISTFFGSLEDAEVNEDNYSRLLEPLARYSLTTQGNTPYTFNVHRLVQAVMRWQMEADVRQAWIGLAVNVLERAFPNPEFENRIRCERLIAHVQALAKLVETNEYYSEALILLLSRAASYLYQRGRYGEAEPLLTKALAGQRQNLPRGHLDIATVINNLATIFQEQGRYSDAEPLFHESLATRQQNLPEEHPDIATSLNNLAALYNIQGRYSDAERLFKEALVIDQKVLPVHHLNLAGDINNIAAAYKSQGRYAEAEPLLREALKIRRQGLSKEHPDIASSLNNLGEICRI